MTIMGREVELQRLSDAIEEASSGAGSVWLLLGEAGIGKTSIAEEAGARARARGFRVLWGRSWEAGGAPAYWPWIQALRALIPDGSAARSLAELLELAGAPVDGGGGAVETSTARFARMDATCTWLLREAARAPLLVVLEDLHAADASTIQLFELLGAAVRSAALVVLATARPEQLETEALRALGREARAVAVGRLDRAAVQAVLGEAADERTAADVYATTEGHPLFVVELLRHLQQGGTLHPGHLPRHVHEIVERRLTALDSDDRALLSLAAVRGRQFAREDLEAARGDLGAALRRCEAAGLVLASADSWRFRHVLIRDVLIATMAPERRREQHARLARRLAMQADSGAVPWSEVALHATSAGNDPALTGRAWLQAGDQALAELAVTEALDAFVRASEVDSDGPTRVASWIGRGRALAASARPDQAREAWTRALEIARELGDPTLVAEASLALGELYRFVYVDAMLVETLERALERLPAEARALRARVMARLAAAMQPAEDVRAPMTMARDAIALARDGCDDATQLYVFGAAISALIDLAEPAERLALNREHAELATRRRAPADAQRAHARLGIDLFELGEIEPARRALLRVEELARERPSAALEWRAAAARAAWALWIGDLETAERQTETVRSAGRRAGDVNAELTWIHQTMMRFRFRGDHIALTALLPTIRGAFTGNALANLSAAAMCGAAVLAMGRPAELDDWIDRDAAVQCAALPDRTVVEALCEQAAARRDPALARRLLARMQSDRGFLTGGVSGMTINGPVERCRALCALALSDTEQAVEQLRDALVRVRSVGARAWEVLIGRELAAIGSDASLGQSIEQLARELGMSAARTVDPRSPITLERDGAAWRYRRGAHAARLKHARGTEILATLLAHPGREFHVLDLMGAGPVDAGDAGVLLDDGAIAAYRNRLLSVRSELDEAASWSDLGRKSRLQEEYEALTRELSAAVGLGGRKRRTHAAAERARVNVRKRITDALRWIAEHDAAGAEALERSIDTGLYCQYRPLP